MFRKNYTILKIPGDECDAAQRVENRSEYSGQFVKQKTSKNDTKLRDKRRKTVNDQKRRHLDGQLQLFPASKGTTTTKLGDKGKLRFESTRATDLRNRVNQPNMESDKFWHMPRFDKVQSTGASLRK